MPVIPNYNRLQYLHKMNNDITVIQGNKHIAASVIFYSKRLVASDSEFTECQMLISRIEVLVLSDAKKF